MKLIHKLINSFSVMSSIWGKLIQLITNSLKGLCAMSSNCKYSKNIYIYIKQQLITLLLSIPSRDRFLPPFSLARTYARERVMGLIGV
jgi:hypothetical protein